MALARVAKPRPAKLPLASDVIKAHVQPHHTVVCVGCNLAPHKDPTALYAGELLAGGSGKLLLLDAQSRTMWLAARKKIDECLARGKPPAPKLLEIRARTEGCDSRLGIGDNVSYRRRIQELKANGMRVKLPVPVWGDIRNNNLPTGGADALIDHGTLEFVTLNSPNKMLETIGKALAEHLRVLKPGGKALLFVTDNDIAGMVERALKEKRLKADFKKHYAEPGFKFAQRHMSFYETNGIVKPARLKHVAIILTKR